MNVLKLGVEVAKSGLVDCFLPLLGGFVIRVDGRDVGSPGLGDHFPLTVPTTSPIDLLIDDRCCDEGCCPGLWATASASGDTVIWSNFRSGELRPEDLPPETVFRFPIDAYRVQIETAKAQLEEIEKLSKCPHFSELTEHLHHRLAAVNLQPNIEWLMADDLIRDYNRNWIRCIEEVGNEEVAASHYEMLRETGQLIEIAFAPHPRFDRTMALLQGTPRPPRERGPSLNLTFSRQSQVGIPVISPLKWYFLRWRFGINQPQRGLADYNLPRRQN